MARTDGFGGVLSLQRIPKRVIPKASDHFKTFTGLSVVEHGDKMGCFEDHYHKMPISTLPSLSMT